MRDRSLFSNLSARAAAEDAGEADIAGSIALLDQAGCIRAVLPESYGGSGLGAGGLHAAGSARVFVRLGETNLSVARLFEGHVNAVELMMLYGDDALRSTVADLVSAGAFLGVWAADSDTPVGLADDGKGLTGRKRYTSGLGVVSHAVITVKTDVGVRLCLVSVGEQARQNRGAWSVTGMKATASGEYDFDAVGADAFRLFGATDCYFDEPWFVGGVWRIAAIQLGGTFGLLEAARSILDGLGRLEAEAQVTRLVAILKRACGGVGLVERAASAISREHSLTDVDRAVARSILARLLSEEIGQEAIRTVERSIGLNHFQAGCETGRIARDLAVYMRQVAGDAFLLRAGKTILSSSDRLSNVYYE